MDFIELMALAGPILLKGTGYTLIFAFSAMFGGLVVGFMLAVARIVPSRWSQVPATVYVSMMRGTPLLVQVFIIYYGLPSIGISFEPLTAGVLALSLNAGAYISESLRGAIIGITRGQWSAGYSLGLTYSQNLYYVVLPQALRLAVPSMSNTLISLIKDTSLVSVITVTELLLATKDVIATTFQPLPLYLAAAGIYWVLSICLEHLQARLEKYFGRSTRNA
ncbi:amino acid ABC transporter permease [Pollutimonas sp. M17]|uniref:amino acid ABC transporter permease n=1 Tax=Pollutimonas sp. M17 TaxID=2962065 RepID=UPI0021F46DDC|nr:amino acid ABC transporter permease [Pollutimonas sp. M17]UYO93785.1 amino acid ABC transporter permease [Pollutimonas sp. M17]HWK71921.1 amino acid ABC transporter permease [Burkholderiaceae bacterium]